MINNEITINQAYAIGTTTASRSTPDYDNPITITQTLGTYTANQHGYICFRWQGGSVNNRLTVNIGTMTFFGGTSSYDSTYEGGTLLFKIKKGQKVTWSCTASITNYGINFMPVDNGDT